VERRSRAPRVGRPNRPARGESYLATRARQTLAPSCPGLSGVAAESWWRNLGWTMMDIGKRIEAGHFG